MSNRHNRRARHRRHKALTLARKHAHKATSALSDRLHDLGIDEDDYRHKLADLLARPALQGKVGATKATAIPPRRKTPYVPAFLVSDDFSAPRRGSDLLRQNTRYATLPKALQALLDNSSWSNDGVHWSNRP